MLQNKSIICLANVPIDDFFLMWRKHGYVACHVPWTLWFHISAPNLGQSQYNNTFVILLQIYIGLLLRLMEIYLTFLVLWHRRKDMKISTPKIWYNLVPAFTPFFSFKVIMTWNSTFKQVVVFIVSIPIHSFEGRTTQICNNALQTTNLLSVFQLSPFLHYWLVWSLHAQ